MSVFKDEEWIDNECWERRGEFLYRFEKSDYIKKIHNQQDTIDYLQEEIRQRNMNIDFLELEVKDYRCVIQDMIEGKY